MGERLGEILRSGVPSIAQRPLLRCRRTMGRFPTLVVRVVPELLTGSQSLAVCPFEAGPNRPVRLPRHQLTAERTNCP